MNKNNDISRKINEIIEIAENIYNFKFNNIEDKSPLGVASMFSSNQNNDEVQSYPKKSFNLKI